MRNLVNARVPREIARKSDAFFERYAIFGADDLRAAGEKVRECREMKLEQEKAKMTAIR